MLVVYCKNRMEPLRKIWEQNQEFVMSDLAVCIWILGICINGLNFCHLQYLNIIYRHKK